MSQTTNKDFVDNSGEYLLPKRIANVFERFESEILHGNEFKHTKEGVVEMATNLLTGAIRSTDADNERYDLISPTLMRRLAETCAEGAKKYGPYNWEKGFPISDLLNHALRHLYLYLSGDRQEDHLAHALWNVGAACHSEENWPELNKELFTARPAKKLEPSEFSTQTDPAGQKHPMAQE